MTMQERVERLNLWALGAAHAVLADEYKARNHGHGFPHMHCGSPAALEAWNASKQAKDEAELILAPGDDDEVSGHHPQIVAAGAAASFRVIAAASEHLIGATYIDATGGEVTFSAAAHARLTALLDHYGI